MQLSKNARYNANIALSSSHCVITQVTRRHLQFSGRGGKKICIVNTLSAPRDLTFLRSRFGFSLLPVVYVRDCRRSVAKDPGLDVHGLGFGVGYGHIYDPLQAFRLTTCDGGHTQTQRLSVQCSIFNTGLIIPDWHNTRKAFERMNPNLP